MLHTNSLGEFLNAKMNYKNSKDLLTEIKVKVREAQLKTVMAANAQML
jgi:hypothetical protein